MRKRDATSSAASDVIVGRWKDGRLGTVRAVVFRVKEIVAAKPQSAGSYRPLALEIVKFFQTGKPPVSNERRSKFSPSWMPPNAAKNRAANP